MNVFIFDIKNSLKNCNKIFTRKLEKRTINSTLNIKTFINSEIYLNNKIDYKSLKDLCII
jgi:hypothetical protein